MCRNPEIQWYESAAETQNFMGNFSGFGILSSKAGTAFVDSKLAASTELYPIQSQINKRINNSISFVRRDENNESGKEAKTRRKETCIQCNPRDPVQSAEYLSERNMVSQDSRSKTGIIERRFLLVWLGNEQ